MGGAGAVQIPMRWARPAESPPTRYIPVDMPVPMDTGTLIRECLAQEPPQYHEALRWAVELINEFRRADPADRTALVDPEPETTGSREWDAFLAACVEWVCAAADVAIPAWTRRPERFLDRWWFVTPYRSLHASAFVHTPAAFANRGVFIHRSSLESI